MTNSIMVIAKVSASEAVEKIISGSIPHGMTCVEIEEKGDATFSSPLFPTNKVEEADRLLKDCLACFDSAKIENVKVSRAERRASWGE